MESRKHTAIALGILLFLGTSPSLVAAADYRPNTMDQPQISERQAREIGLDRVPQGSVMMARLEHRDGRPVWFLDIAGYNNRSRQEVLVDASNGQVLESHARALTGPPRAETNQG
jgi:uncharacterized membrane protein YkoI